MGYDVRIRRQMMTLGVERSYDSRIMRQKITYDQNYNYRTIKKTITIRTIKLDDKLLHQDYGTSKMLQYKKS